MKNNIKNRVIDIIVFLSLLTMILVEYVEHSKISKLNYGVKIWIGFALGVIISSILALKDGGLSQLLTQVEFFSEEKFSSYLKKEFFSYLNVCIITGSLGSSFMMLGFFNFFDTTCMTILLITVLDIKLSSRKNK